MRRVATVAVGAAMVWLGAHVLGEYEFVSWRGPVTGVLFGAATGEALLATAGRRSLTTAALAAVCAAGGLVWAGAISVAGRDEPVPGGAWVAAVLGALAAAGWVRALSRGEGVGHLHGGPRARFGLPLRSTDWSSGGRRSGGSRRWRGR